MKLAAPLVEKTLSQFEAEPIPADHPVLPQLTQMYGDHTFFLDDNGLNIVEPAEPTGEGIPAGTVVKLARWNDDDHTSLAPHEPEPTELVAVFGAGGPNGAD